MPREYSEIKASLKKAHPDWSAETLSKKAAKTFGKVFGTNPQHAEELQKQGKWEAYKRRRFGKSKKASKELNVMEEFVPNFSVKEENGQIYVEGFLSDPTIDLGNDIIDDQQKIVDQVSSGNAIASKLSWRHDWLKDGNNFDLLPFGSLVPGSAKLRENKISGENAAWAAYKLNREYPDFDSKVSQIKEGHVNAFSIEYEVLPGGAEKENIGNTRVRHIKEFRIVGIGVAARPMHPNAVMSGFYAKEIEMDDSNTSYSPAQKTGENGGKNGGKSMETKELAEQLEKQKKELDEREKLIQAKEDDAKKKEEEAAAEKKKKEDEAKKADPKKDEKAAETASKEVSAEMKELKEFKDSVAKEFSGFVKEKELKEKQVKELETKEKEIKDFEADYKENPTWNKASELIRMNGGLSNIEVR